MTSLKPFHAPDLFKTNAVNLDVLTENYHINFYLSYLVSWPTLFFSTENPQGDITGYSEISLLQEYIYMLILLIRSLN